MPSPESSQEPVAAAVPPLQLVLPVPTSLFLCLCRSFVFLCLLCFGFHRSQTDSLDSTNTPCSCGLSHRSANKQNVLAWIRILDLILTFAFYLAVLAITFPFLAKAVHIHRI